MRPPDGPTGADPPGADDEPGDDGPGDEPTAEELVEDPLVGAEPAGVVVVEVDGGAVVDDEVEGEVVDEDVDDVVDVAAGWLVPPWVARAATAAISSPAMARAAASIDRRPTIGT